MATYAQGGWYDNPATGKNQRWMNGGFLPVGQTETSGGSSNITAGSDQVNKYIDQLLSNSQGQRDLAIKQLDTQHKLALGNNDQDTAKFLESVADGLEAKTGRIPYDYQRYSNRELQQYALGNQAISENKGLALDKLKADQQAFDQNLGYSEGNQNRATTEDLNSRGLLYGQHPAGGTNVNQPGYNPLTGLTGNAGQQAGIQNQGFANQSTQQGTQFGLQGTGIKNDFGQQQRTLDFNHANTMQDLTVDARRNAQDEGNTYQFGVQGANLGFDATKNNLENQRAALQRANAALNANSQGRTNQIAGY